jgi:hypothetical protein
MDTAQVTELAAADTRARDALVAELDEHGPMLLAAARVITLDNDEAHDLVQTTFEIAIRRLDGLREPRALRAWLLTIQTREAFRVVRRLHRLVSLDGQVGEIAVGSIDIAGRADMRAALSRLPRRNGVVALVPVSREIWIKPDGSGRLIESRSEPIWFGPADRAAWVAEGSPDFHIQPHADTTFGPTPSGVDPSTSPTAAPQVWPGSLYYEDVDTLPTDTGTLRQLIDARAAANGGPIDYERFTIVGDLLRETVAAPKVRAALFRVAAGLNGVELIGSVTDRAGRTGMAVSMTNAQSSRGLERRTLIFDPETSALLAEEEVILDKVDWLDAEPPVVIGYNTYLVSDIVAAIP